MKIRGNIHAKNSNIDFKGGTGKTTTAVNLNHALSFKDFKVLIIDCDPHKIYSEK